MSPRVAKILGAFMLVLWAVGFYYGFVLGLIAAIIFSVFIFECLVEMELLPPKSTSPGERGE